MKILYATVSLSGTLALLFGACTGEYQVCEPGIGRDCACTYGTLGAQSCQDDGMSWAPCMCGCEPGLVRTCPCLNGSAGVQACNGDGSSWSACECGGGDGDLDGDVDVDADGDVDGDVDGDTDGDTDGDGDVDGDTDGDGDTSPDLCDSCTSSDECGSPADLCLVINATSERFCSQDCAAGSSCPNGYSCYLVGGGGSYAYQCVPDDLTCGDTPPPPDCDPPCAAGEVCRDGVCETAGDWDAELQHCVDETNRHRAAHGLSALSRSTEIEQSCAMPGAEEDAASGMAHGHFSRTSGCGGLADAENEIPGWPMSMYGSVTSIITAGLQMMMDEGPGGGHYENILGSHTMVGCGIFVTSSSEVWVVQDFR